MYCGTFGAVAELLNFAELNDFADFERERDLSSNDTFLFEENLGMLGLTRSFLVGDNEHRLGVSLNPSSSFCLNLKSHSSFAGSAKTRGFGPLPFFTGDPGLIETRLLVEL